MTNDNQVQGFHVAGEAEIDKDEGVKRALASKFKAAAFGEIVSVLMRSTPHRSMALAQVEALLVPPILSKQYLVAKAKPKDDSDVPGMPVGVVIWARVSDELDRKLASDLDKPLQLSHADWTSGDHLWIIDVIGTAATAAAMLDELKRTTFAGREVKLRAIKDGNIVVERMSGALAS